MKTLLLILTLFTFASAGFFNDANESGNKESAENARLCTLFTEKAKTYKKTMRSDDLAAKTLLSYEKRAALYCNKAK